MNLLKLFFSLNGTIGRKQFLLGILTTVILSIIIHTTTILFAYFEIHQATFTPALILIPIYTSGLSAIIAIWSILVFIIKRFHDLNKSAWNIFTLFLIFPIIQLFFRKSITRENRFQNYIPTWKDYAIILLSILYIIVVISGNIHNFFTPQQEIPIKKPIIYLYPKAEMNVEVSVGRPQNLLHTYPKYADGWKVLARPNGDLTDLKTGRSLYALYWEGKNIIPSNTKEGFIVPGKDTISFLEDKLALLGLTPHEAEEFIIYWLPKMENHKFNFIRFQNMAEINHNMPLSIQPKPDSLIRVMMEFKPLNKPFNVKEQTLTTPNREGFIAVEWGGTEIR